MKQHEHYPDDVKLAVYRELGKTVKAKTLLGQHQCPAPGSCNRFAHDPGRRGLFSQK